MGYWQRINDLSIRIIPISSTFSRIEHKGALPTYKYYIIYIHCVCVCVGVCVCVLFDNVPSFQNSRALIWRRRRRRWWDPVVVNCFVKNHLQCSDILSFYNRAFLFYPQFPFIKKSFVINKRFFTSLCFCYFFYILYIHTYVGTFSFVLNTICKLSLQLLQKKLLYKYEKIKKWLIDMQLFILSSSRSLSRFN